MNVKSRIHRTIKNFDNYFAISEENSKSYLEDLVLQDSEICYGIYENNPENKQEIIAVTDKGLHLYENDSWHFFQFNEIDSVTIESDKQDAEHITLYFNNGKLFLLPVKGRKGKFKDIFEFSRFLARVVEDIKKSEK